MSSIVHIYRRFPTPESCITHLETVRWQGKPLCPYCGAEKASKHTEAHKTRWQCGWCHKSFSVTVGTIFHNSHVDLQRWFLLIALMFSAKKGLSAMQAARDLEMRRPTVWSMMHRIRAAMTDDGKLLAGIVEMDETQRNSRCRGQAMSQLRAILDRINDVESVIAQIAAQATPETAFADRLTLQSPENRRDSFRDELADITS